MADNRPRLVDVHDLATLFGMPLMALAAWLLPERAWPWVARSCRPFYDLTLPQGARTLAHRIGQVLGPQGSHAAASTIVARLVEEDILDLLGLLRCHRPGGWNPAIEVIGAEHIEAGLARGRGVVLWVGHFAHADLIAKMGCHRAGHRLHHLSHPRHGYSATGFGMAVLNPIKTSIERRYLAERVLLAPESAKGALARLRQCLLDNKLVSVSARRTARNPVSAPFLDGAIAFGPGAPYLAFETGAQLNPVFAMRTGRGHFEVRIEAPLAVPQSSDRREAIQSLVDRYAERTAAAVRRHPDQWLGWTTL